MQLPPELVDLVLHSLADHKDTLRSCSLVCKVWLPTIRRLLFNKMTLGPRTNYDALTKIMRTSPGILHCVKSLKITTEDGLLYPNRAAPILFLSDPPTNLVRLELSISGSESGIFLFHTHAFGSWLISTLLPVFTKAVYAYMQNFSKLNILIFHVWLDSTSPVFWDAKLFTSIPKSVSIIETTFNNKACLRQIPNLIWTPGTHGTAFLACLDVLVASKLRRLKVVRATFNLNYEAEEIGEEELAQSLAKLWMSKRGILISSFDVPRWLNWGP